MKAELAVIQYSGGSLVSLLKFGKACEGIAEVKEGQTLLLHVKTRGSDAQRRAVNDAFAIAAVRGFTAVTQDLMGMVEVFNRT